MLGYNQVRQEQGQEETPVLGFFQELMDNLSLYNIDSKYVEYLCRYSPNLYVEKDSSKTRKYIGIVLVINNFRYFVPLTSFKKKHLHLSNSIDFMKIGKIAAINLNKMIPVPIGCYFRVVVEKEEDPFYRKLLYREQRYIKKHQQIIKDNASLLYKKVLKNPDSKLAKRSNDFKLLESVCKDYR